ncbi:MAG: hypothetical protein SNJ82_13645, partial [Gemmataceae bacterium]
HRGSLVAELTWPELHVVRWIQTQALQAHNLWKPDGGPLLTCDTMRGTLQEVESGRIVWRAAAINQMTRGLACDGQHVYVGMSQTTSRNRRGDSDGGIWILDKKTWCQIDFLPLPAAGNVHEIRLIDVPDECHHGIPLRAVPSVDLERSQAHTQRVQQRLANRRGAGWLVFFGQPEFPGTEVRLAPEGHLNLLVAEGVHLKDVVVQVEMEADLSRDPRHTGIIARYSGPGDTGMVCALIELIKGKAYVGLWESPDNTWNKLAHTPLRSIPQRLELELQGPHVLLRVEGQKVLQTTTRVLQAGTVGLRGQTGRFRAFQAQAIGDKAQREVVFPLPSPLVRAA